MLITRNLVLLLLLLLIKPQLCGDLTLNKKEKEIYFLRGICSQLPKQQIPEIEEKYKEQIFADALCKLSDIDEDQYFLYVDRNPEKQLIFVLFFDSEKKRIVEIDCDRVSTGNPKKAKDYFLTPTGIFRNKVEILGYRASGTKNSKGWRGLGKKGARVWDFGWQKSSKKPNGTEQKIRFLLHATDPIGEERLGKVDSKGCIRISNALNKFLDYYGVIDKEYEAKKSSLLLKKREPVTFQGSILIVGDSIIEDSSVSN